MLCQEYEVLSDQHTGRSHMRNLPRTDGKIHHVAITMYFVCAVVRCLVHLGYLL
jgi:hypothetical protein